MATPIEKARNLGPTSGAELRSVGIDTLERLVDLGWEEALRRWVIGYPDRINLNAATALIGAVDDVDWREVSPRTKKEARAFLEELRENP